MSDDDYEEQLRAAMELSMEESGKRQTRQSKLDSAYNSFETPLLIVEMKVFNVLLVGAAGCLNYAGMIKEYIAEYARYQLFPVRVDIYDTVNVSLKFNLIFVCTRDNFETLAASLHPQGILFVSPSLTSLIDEALFAPYAITAFSKPKQEGFKLYQLNNFNYLIEESPTLFKKYDAIQPTIKSPYNFMFNCELMSPDLWLFDPSKSPAGGGNCFYDSVWLLASKYLQTKNITSADILRAYIAKNLTVENTFKALLRHTPFMRNISDEVQAAAFTSDISFVDYSTLPKYSGLRAAFTTFITAKQKEIRTLGTYADDFVLECCYNILKLNVVVISSFDSSIRKFNTIDDECPVLFIVHVPYGADSAGLQNHFEPLVPVSSKRTIELMKVSHTGYNWHQQ